MKEENEKKVEEDLIEWWDDTDNQERKITVEYGNTIVSARPNTDDDDNDWDRKRQLILEVDENSDYNSIIKCPKTINRLIDELMKFGSMYENRNKKTDYTDEVLRQKEKEGKLKIEDI